MGYERFNNTDWSNYQSANAGKSKSQQFSSTQMKSTHDPRSSFDPKTVACRESRDSQQNPLSTPIILGFDVTGSMGDIPYQFVQQGLGVLMTEIFDRKPVTDPHILCMAIGDARSDRAPLQVTQFEADIRIAKQIEELYLEGNGGGNHGESYNLPWLFAALKTSTDCFEKRGKRGLLFTIGDEPPLMTLEKKHAKEFLGIELERDLATEEVLEMVRRHYDVFHVIIEEGSGLSTYGAHAVIGGWNKLLGEGRVLRLSDYRKLSEVVISAIQVNAGADVDSVVKSWSGDTSLVVAAALAKNVPGAPGSARSRKRGGGGPVFLQPTT